MQSCSIKYSLLISKDPRSKAYWRIIIFYLINHSENQFQKLFWICLFPNLCESNFCTKNYSELLLLLFAKISSSNIYRARKTWFSCIHIPEGVTTIRTPVTKFKINSDKLQLIPAELWWTPSELWELRGTIYLFVVTSLLIPLKTHSIKNTEWIYSCCKDNRKLMFMFLK